MPAQRAAWPREAWVAPHTTLAWHKRCPKGSSEGGGGRGSDRGRHERQGKGAGTRALSLRSDRLRHRGLSVSCPQRAGPAPPLQLNPSNPSTCPTALPCPIQDDPPLPRSPEQRRSAQHPASSSSARGMRGPMRPDAPRRTQAHGHTGRAEEREWPCGRRLSTSAAVAETSTARPVPGTTTPTSAPAPARPSDGVTGFDDVWDSNLTQEMTPTHPHTDPTGTVAPPVAPTTPQSPGPSLIYPPTPTPSRISTRASLIRISGTRPRGPP